MKTLLSPFVQLISHSLRHLRGRAACQPIVNAESPVPEAAETYRGLFQGVIENGIESSPIPAAMGLPLGTSGHRSTANACGFVRFEMDGQKKATGAFLLFSDGEVLTGTMEGATAPQGNFLEARFRLQTSSVRKPTGRGAVPTLARGRVDLAGIPVQRLPVHEQPVTGEHHHLTIRFV